MESVMNCPRCNGIKFIEHDCGSDSYDDDICWSSQSCEVCGLWHSNWTDKWYIDCASWRDEDDAEEFIQD
jgi:hypothetical protein